MKHSRARTPRVTVAENWHAKCKGISPTSRSNDKKTNWKYITPVNDEIIHRKKSRRLNSVC